ncbi:class I SAM-dependent methyltransferase [bacterium]|nr:class I SAM-dependent methyltransferase [bacterium]
MADKIRKVKQFYDKETSRYLADRYAGESCEQFSYKARKQIVLEFLKNTEGNILDVGCGPAIFTAELFAMGLRPYSVDLSLEMLKKARTLAALEHRASWFNCEIERLPFKDRTFDNVISIGVIAYTNDTLQAIRELARVLKPGGLLVIQCSNSLAPTPAIVGLKDKILSCCGMRQQRWNFKLTSHRFGRFRKFLEQSGLHVEHKRSYDFRLPFLEKFFPIAAVNLMKRLQLRFEKSEKLGWLGEGYVVKARKN